MTASLKDTRRLDPAMVYHNPAPRRMKDALHSPSDVQTSGSLFSDDWLSRAQRLVNADPELQLIGRWFTTSFSLTAAEQRCTEQRCIVEFEHGHLARAIASPRLDVRCAFGFRADPDIWTRFFAKDPEPLYHDFFAMLMRVPGFVLEGDTLIAMQHARALHRAMNLMRTVQP
jgi:hypothetical protein